MRWLLIALLVAACVRDEPRQIPQAHAPALVVIAPAIMAPATVAPAAVAPAIVVPALPPSPTAIPSALAAAAEPAVAAMDPREATRKAAHDVLAKYCGECHEGHRSSNAKALAVYDLDKPDWPARFDERISKGALRRLASKSDAARDAFIAFRDAEQSASSASTN